MGPVKKHIKEIDAYEKDIKEDLTINDALILVTICAAKERANIDNDQFGDTKRIVTLVQDHPIFSDLFSSGIELSINKFINMIKDDDTVKYVRAAAKILKPEHKETAFTWTATILMPDGVLTKARKDILDRFAMILSIDKKVVQKILVQVSQTI